MSRLDDQLSRQKAEKHLYGLSDETVACRGDHHDWPVLRPGKLPRGVSAVPDRRDGSFQIKVRCRNCGRVRTKTTMPGGALDTSARWGYEGGPADFSLARTGVEATRADFTAELWRRLAETLRELG
jgi:hypothetical protein